MYHKPTNSIRQQLINVKDKTDTLKKCGVVYSIKCEQCNENYVGETARSLDTRLKEHTTKSNSAIFEHCDATGHVINYKNTKILASEDHNVKRKVKEAIKIKKHRPTLNRDEGMELPSIYNSLLVSRDILSRDNSNSLMKMN